MKKVLFLATFVCSVLLLNAQKSIEAPVSLDKQSYPGFSINISSTDIDIVENAMKYLFEQKYAFKGSNASGFRVYHREQFAPFGTDGYDIYYKVEQNGPKKNQEVKVSLLVSTIGNMNFLSSSIDEETAKNVLAFLDDFVRFTIPEYQTVIKISELSATLKKLQDKKSDLEKKKDKLNKDLVNTQKAITDVENEIKTNAEDIEKTEKELNKLNRK